MPPITRGQLGGACGYVVHRGNGRQRVFPDEQDHAVFVEWIGQNSALSPLAPEERKETRDCPAFPAFPSSREKRRVIMRCCVINILVFASVLCGCRSGRDEARGRRIVATMVRLRSVGGLILIYEAQPDPPPPPPTSSVAERVEWLRPLEWLEVPEIDYDNKTIKDAWGSEIVLMSTEGVLVALGSPGPDLTWQRGEGDDIVQRLDDLKNER